MIFCVQPVLKYFAAFAKFIVAIVQCQGSWVLLDKQKTLHMQGIFYYSFV